MTTGSILFLLLLSCWWPLLISDFDTPRRAFSSYSTFLMSYLMTSFPRLIALSLTIHYSVKRKFLYSGSLDCSCAEEERAGQGSCPVGIVIPCSWQCPWDLLLSISHRTIFRSMLKYLKLLRHELGCMAWQQRTILYIHSTDYLWAESLLLLCCLEGSVFVPHTLSHSGWLGLQNPFLKVLIWHP